MFCEALPITVERRPNRMMMMMIAIA